MDIPIVSLDAYLSNPSSPAALAEAIKAAESLILTGALVVRDSRAPTEANDRFIDLFEDYFALPDEVSKRDERPELGYQVGVTLENTEKPKCGSDEECLSIIEKLESGERPLDLTGHGADPKCRFFHRMSEAPRTNRLSRYRVRQMSPQSPSRGYGKTHVEGVTRMLAVGLGEEEDTFLQAGRYGSHLLAPTATNLDKYGKLDTIFAGFHTDLNFLTIHGQSRYPGLHIWARNSGKRISVRIPEGCLLVQAGKQLEWITGGLIKAGFHEVFCTKATLAAMKRRRKDHPERALFRISSTFFWHLSPDFHLAPLPLLQNTADNRFGQQKDYGEMLVGDQVRKELGLIALMAVE